MKRKTNMRILAWLLSVCMVLGLVPSVPAEVDLTALAADQETEYVYSFSGLATADYTELVHSNKSILRQDVLDTWTYANTPGMTGGEPWRYVTAQTTSSRVDTVVGAMKDSIYCKARSVGTATVYLAFTAPESGKFNVLATYRAAGLGSSGAAGTIAVHDIDASDRVGNALIELTDIGASGSSDLGVVTLVKGREYVFKASSYGGSTGKDHYLYLEKIALKKYTSQTTEYIFNFADMVDAESNLGTTAGNSATTDVAKSLTYEYTEAKGSAPWKFYGLWNGSPNNNTYVRIHPTNGLVPTSTGGGRSASVSVLLMVEKAGMYMVTAEYYHAGANSTGTLTLNNGKGSEALWKFTKTDADSGFTTVTSDPIYIAYGEHVLSSHVGSTASGWTNMSLKSITLTPVVQEAAATYTYDFIAGRPATVSGSTQINTIEDLKSFDYVVNKGSAPWKTMDSTSAAVYYLADSTTSMPGLYPQGKKVIQNLVIQVPQSGLYRVKYKAKVRNVFDMTRFYMYPSDENGNVASGAALTDLGYGRLDTWSAEDTFAQHTFPQGELYIKSGYYKLVLEHRNKQASIDAIILEGIDLDVNFEAPAPVAVGASVSMPITVALPGGSSAPIDVIETPDADEYASYAVEGDSLVITGKKAGTTFANVKVVAADAESTIKVPVTVYDPDEASLQTYDYVIKKSPSGLNISNINSFNMTTAGAEEEISPQTPSQPWKVKSLSNYATSTQEPSSYGVCEENNTATYVIRVPASGRYKFQMLAMPNSATGVVSFSIKSADGKGSYAGGKNLGSIDTNGSGSADTAFDYGVVDLVAGDYELTMTTAASPKDASAKRAYFSTFRLQGVAKISMDLAIDKTEFDGSVGDKIEFVPTATQNGAAVSAADLSFELSTMPIGMAEVVKEGDKFYIVSKAMGDWTGTLTANRISDGATGSVEISGSALAEDDKADKYVYKFNEMVSAGGTIDTLPELQSFTNSTSKGSAPYKYHSGNTMSFRASGNGLDMSDSTSALMIFVPSAGKYRVGSTLYARSSWGYGNYTLTPCDGNGTATGDAIDAGRVDGFSTIGDKAINEDLNTVELNRGYYILTMQAGRIDSAHRSIFVNDFSLTRLNNDLNWEAPAPIAIGSKVEMSFGEGITGITADGASIVSCEFVDGKLAITGLSAGQGVLNVTVTGANGADKLEVPVFVYDSKALGANTYTYNIGKASDNLSGTSAYLIKNWITSFNKTTSGATGEVSPARPSAPWKFESSVDGEYFNVLYPHSYAALLGDKAGTKGTSIRIRVPENGRYEVYHSGAKGPDNGMLKLYVQRADGTGYYSARTLIGAMDMYKATADAVGTDYMFGTLDLAAGDYIITYELTKTGSTGSYMRAAIDALILKGTTTQQEYTLDVFLPENILVGQTYNIPIVLAINHSIPVDTTGYTYSIVSNSNPAFGEIEIVEDGNGGVNLKVTGARDGESRVVINATNGTTTITGSCLISTVNKEMLYEDLVYNFQLVNPYVSGDYIPVAKAAPTFDASIKAGSAPFKFLSNKSTGLFDYITKSYAFFMNLRGTRQLVIHVFEDNYYVPVANVHYWSEGTTCGYRLTPSDADGNPMGDTIDLGVVSSSGSSSYVGDVSLKPVYLNKGYYILDFVIGELKYITDYFILKQQAVIANTESPDPIAVGETVEIPAKLELLSEPGVSASYDYATFDPEDASVAEFIAQDGSDTIKIKGLRAGTTNVAIRYTCGTISARHVISVTVYDNSKTQDDSFRYWLGKVNANMAMSDVTSFNLTTKGVSGELNPVKETSPWRFEGSADKAEFTVYMPDAYGALLGKTAGTSIRIRVPKAGKYIPVSENWFQNEGGKLSVYIQKADGKGTFANKALLGSFNTYAESNEENVLRKTILNGAKAIDLDAGDYIITYVNEGDAVRTAIGAFTLENASYGDMKKFSISPKGSTVARIGKTVKVPLNFQFTDGYTYDVVAPSLSINASKDDLVTTDVILENNNAFVNITGIKQGQVSLEITATVNGTSKTATVMVDVLPDDEGVPRSLKYDFMIAKDQKEDLSFATDETYYSFDASEARGSDPWKVLGFTGGFFSIAGTIYPNWGLNMQGQGGYQMVLRVPAAGDYDLTIDTYFYWLYTPLTMSLTPCNANGVPNGAAINLGKFTAVLPKYGDAEYRGDKYVGSVSLEAGYYLFNMELKDSRCPNMIGDKTYASRARVNALKFDLLRLVMSGNLTANTYALVNAEKRIPLNARLDGANVDWAEDATFTVTVEDVIDANAEVKPDKILDARVEKSADGKSAELVINGLAVGKSNVRVDVTMGGQTAKLVGVVNVVADGNVLGEVSLAESYITVDAANTDDTKYIVASASNIDGTAVDMSKAKIYYKSANQAVVNVTDAGKIVPMGAGSTNVTVYVEYKGVTLSSDAIVRVIDASSVESVAVSAPKTVQAGESFALSASAKRASGLKEEVTAADINIVEIIYKGEEELVEGVDTYTVAGGNIVLNYKGEYEIAAQVKGIDAEKITVKAVAPASVSAMQINFKENQIGEPSNATYSTQGWMLDRAKTSSVALALRENLQYMTGVGVKAKVSGTTARDADLAVSFSTDSAGVYEFDIVGGAYPDGAVASIYVDDIALGEYSFNGKGASASNVALLNAAELAAGEHTLTIRRVSGGDYIYPGIININRINALPTLESVTVVSEKKAITIGEVDSALISANMSNGRPYNFTALDYYGNTNANSYSVSVTGAVAMKDAASSYVTIKGAAKGMGTVSATATVGETTLSGDKNYTVENIAVSEFKLELDKESLFVGEKANATVTIILANGKELSLDDVEYTVSTNEYISYADGVVTGIKAGDAELSIDTVMGDAAWGATYALEVKDHGVTGLVLNADTTVMGLKADPSQVYVRLQNSDGATVIAQGLTYTVFAEDDTIVNAYVDDAGKIWVAPLALGETDVTVMASNGFVGTLSFKVTDGKTAGSYYTPEKVAAARENARIYDWAASTIESNVKTAERLLPYLDDIYTQITSNELPRASTPGFRYFSKAVYCPYCDTDIVAKYGSSAWLVDPINNPWKIQCPECRKRFPSNDFESFYKLGLDENGIWHYEKSMEENQKIIDNGGEGYLVNKLYPEMEGTLNMAGEPITNWGVDDGYGFWTGAVENDNYSLSSYKNFKVREGWTFIAYYNHYGLWISAGKTNNDGIIQRALSAFRWAYLYTGKVEYGRAAAVLLDRIADVYPDMSFNWMVEKFGQPYYTLYYNSDSTVPKGKQLGCIWQHQISREFTLAYDAIFDVYDQPGVISEIRNRKKNLGIAFDIETPNQMREKIEENILRENMESIYNADIHGNFGMQQSLAAYTAVVWDTMPESRELIDWMYRSGIGAHGSDEVTGGNTLITLINNVRRDGNGNEAGPNYNALWNNGIETIAEALDGYDGYSEMDMYKNPKFIMMLKSFMPLIMTRNTTVQVGDSGRTAQTELIAPAGNRLMRMYQKTGDPEFAQFAYFLNGNKTDGMHMDIFTPNPNDIQKEIQQAIDKYGEYNWDASNMIAGYGFAALRGGSKYADKDTQRDFWMYFGKASGHGHPDTLNLGIHAYGLDFAPEMGYPEMMDGGEITKNWGYTSINHNLVIVNGAKQTRIQTNADPKHFDDSGRVKVMDVDATGGPYYRDTEQYRRTVVMVEANDEVSYGIDFFRIDGGSEHLYSFHALSNEIAETQGLNLGATQTIGSYAGIDVPYRKAGYSNSYTYFNNIRRDTNMQSNEFAVDFKITDFRKTLPSGADKGLHLRMTMLNDFKLSEVSIQNGETPRYAGNPGAIEFVFAKRVGTNLDSLFTTVFEPYNYDRYIKNMTQVTAQPMSGVEYENDKVKAIKVELTNGRTDYVIYATNKNVLYRIDNKFDFRGFVGVQSYNADDYVIYSYINDGDVIGDTTAQAAYTGRVKGFTKDLNINNYLEVELDSNADVNELVGRYIYIENDGSENAVYPIKSATVNGRNAQLYVGGETFIRGCIDATNMDAGYVYNIEDGAAFTIPLSKVSDSAPVFNEVPKQTAVVGREFTLSVSATSPINAELTYEAVSLPRGVTFDPETRIITWKPDSYQVGDHHIEIKADDGDMASNIHISVVVYKSSAGSGSVGEPTTPTTPSTPTTPTTPSTPSEGGSGSAGGGAGGGSTTPSTPTTPETPAEPDAPATGEGEETPETPDGSADKFVDLGNHSWAKDAIYNLVDKGVVNGTSENTYAPANNIKRADFAIMLVRAFGITEGEGENFADVDANKYYAEELRLAKAAGIVNGIGDDKFNPEGEITRQDMMLMLSRALDAMEVELSDADRQALAEFADAAQISDYAADAVSRMIKDGIIAGSNGKINPLAKATRAEIAVMLERVLSK